MHERKHHLRKYEDTANSLLKRDTFEYKSWIDNEVFDIGDVRKFKPKNFVTGRWVVAIKSDKQGNFLRA